MQCPRCKHDNPAHAKFCLECGGRFAVACAQCGTELPAGAKFCLECGRPTAGPGTEPARFASPQSYTPRHLAERILTSKSALEGERKHVTVLFADLKGSTELLADRDPEEARQLLDPVLERMMEAVHRYEGTVNQVMGDGIMALFGAPVAHEDHAVRASYAALDMQAAIRSYAEEVRRSHGIAVEIRVGLNSGEVVVRAIGSDLHMDYTAVGTTTHLAARMEQLATGGRTLLTADTLRLAEGYIEVKPLGPVPIKGVGAPIEVYEMVAAGPLRSRLRAAAARGLTRLVGREAELEQLGLALGRAASGHGQVVAVVGEPGVGKSRLVWEATHSHRAHGWSIVLAGSVSYGKATPYLSVIDLLKGYFHIEDRDDHRRIREKVTGRLLTLDETLKPTLSAFLTLLDVPVDDIPWQMLDPMQRRQRTLDAVKRLLLLESQLQPLLVVFEDLHWIDSETQAFLDSLVESLPSARLMLLVNYRPEYEHRWGSKTYYTQLRADPLPPESANGLLQALLGSHDGLLNLKRLLVERTEGNPFFLEESVRTLVETGALVGERGAYRPGRPPDVIQVPATVQAVLAARIDRLPPEEKRLLQTAAVIGTDVPYAVLRAVGEMGEEELRGSLAHLQAAEFLLERTLFPEPVYAFRHALSHEVAYGSLLHGRRRDLHAQIAEVIERLHGERRPEHVERLAYHALRGEAWSKAVAYLREAGRKAVRHSAHREAIASLEQALAVLQHLPSDHHATALAIDLRLEMAPALAQAARYRDILQRMKESQPLAESLGDPTRLGQVLLKMAQALRLTGEYEDALRAGDRAVAIADELGDPLLRSGTRHRLGQIHFATGAYIRAVELLRKSVDLLGGLTGTPDELGYIRGVGVHAWLGYVLAVLGEFNEAIPLARRALGFAESGDRPGDLIVALGVLGGIHLVSGDHLAAMPVLERGLALCQRWGILDWSPTMSAGLATAYAHAGRFEEAIALHRHAAEEEAREAQGTPTAGVLRLGETYALANRLDEARGCAERALGLSRTFGERGSEARALWLLAEIDASRDPPDVGGAEAHYRDARALADELGMRPLLAHCDLGLGKHARRIGDRPTAQEHLAAATAMYREMDMRFGLEQAEAEIRELAGGRS